MMVSEEGILAMVGVLSGYLKHREPLLHGEVHAKSLAHTDNGLSKLSPAPPSKSNIFRSPVLFFLLSGQNLPPSWSYICPLALILFLFLFLFLFLSTSS